MFPVQNFDGKFLREKQKEFEIMEPKQIEGWVELSLFL